MIRHSGMTGRGRVALVTGIVLVAGMARAQSLSTPTFTNGSNPNELFAGTATSPSYERETSALVLASSPGGSFVTRFAALTTADGDGSSGAGHTESLFVNYTINFTATAPGAYRLIVDTVLRGDLLVVNDGANGGSADISAVTGAQAGGSLIAGGLGLADGGSAAGSSGALTGIEEINSGTIFGVSNGAPVAHTINFQWSTAATTNTVPGDEAAIRLGGTSDVATETAGNYPGTPARIQAEDGHFVTVTLESLCGNNVLDFGPSYNEDCDEGSSNGSPSSCCTSNCTFKADGSSCNDINTCTLGDSCQSGTCVPSSQQLCNLCETCDPMGGCQIGPQPTCKDTTLPFKASLKVVDKTPDDGDSIAYQWTKGQATATTEFGYPLTTHDYALCLFDSADQLLYQATAPAAGVCGTRPCWKALSIRGFRYKDSARTPDGADSVKLLAGLAGKAKVQFKGKGPNLPAFGLPYTLPITAQLQSSNGTCFEATFSNLGTTANTATQFKGKAN